MDIYPANPHLPQDLSLESSGIKKQAWLAVIGLLSFVLVYLALIGWFSWSAYQLLFVFTMEDRASLFTFVLGGSSIFLAIFMAKALFFVKKGGMGEEYEVTIATEPQLFQFLNRLADETGAPRPHRVFLSPRVNAAVFYDISLLNFIFPSRKNLEIGLPLVNVLTITELKAVLAHEFGHFAQKSMAVGNWVYVAQQIAAHIIARRDALDNLLKFISNIDLRIAWIGWALRLVVWSLRATMETIFNLVMLAQRALSREMEFQADLVAVSVTGSDALIHALSKLQAADEAWDDAQSFINDQIANKKAPSDIFNIHLDVMQRIGSILNKPKFGKVDPVPQDNPHLHRVFTADIAQPPRMWATHPYNHERENNAKRIYVAAQLDERESWIIFDNPEKLKEQFTQNLLSRFEVELGPQEEMVEKLNSRYAFEYLKSCYRGAYLGRSFIRYAEKPSLFYQGNVENAIDALKNLYPEDLSQQLEQLRSLERERNLLIALRDGVYTPPDGVIRFRGNEIKKRELAEVIETVSGECSSMQNAIFKHDQICRTAHLKAAEKIGNGWKEYLQGLLVVLHYADHLQANLNDSCGAMNNVYAVITADRNVSSKELSRLIDACYDVYRSMAVVYQAAADVQLDSSIKEELAVESWAAALGEFSFASPDKNNINQWLNAHGSWVGATSNALSALRRVSLESLLKTEAKIAEWIALDASEIPPAPDASVTPTEYPLMTPGKERVLQKRLGLWDRFQTADGLAAAVARFVVATSIVGGALYLTAYAQWSVIF